jgi:hypothetical protein
MNAQSIQNLIKPLTINILKAYLVSQGWTQILHKNQIFIYEKGDESLLLPSSNHFADYTERIYDVIEFLAHTEKKDIISFVQDLLLDPCDVIRFRIVHNEADSGTVPLDAGFNFLESAKKILFITACDLVQPEKYHKRLSLKGAQQFINNCRVGQTERGSFILPIICPFIENDKEEKPRNLSLYQKDLIPNSFTRKVTNRLMWSLSFVKSCIDSDELDKVIDLEGEQMISSNFLESIIDLLSILEKIDTEISASWSPFNTFDQKLPQKLKISSDYLQPIEAISSKIKKSSEEDIEDIFYGKISQCKANPDSHNRTEGEITFNFLYDEEKVLKAKILLKNEDYNHAINAHLEGKTVQIKGTLKTYGRTKIIENAVLTDNF